MSNPGDFTDHTHGQALHTRYSQCFDDILGRFKSKKVNREVETSFGLRSLVP